jgi:putative sensory protein
MNVFTGATREVSVDQMLFSTTDERGVIGFSNRAFVELSEYSREQLVGAPHSVIRHPEMPGGAFRTMWDTLKAGRPFAAYLRNLAADGAEYDVFATIAPLDEGGYLSVGFRPTVDELLQTALSAYDRAKALEDSLDGADRHEAAGRGAGKILELLSEAGVSSYEEMQSTALPAEVARREELAGGLPERPEATGTLGEALEGVKGIARELDAWMERSSALADLSGALRTAGESLEREMNDETLTADALDSLDRSDPGSRSLAELLDVWIHMQEIVAQPVGRLHDVLSRLDANSAQTRFHVALARLHTTMMAQFIAELVDEGADADAAASAIGMLAGAVRRGLADMESQADTQRRLAAETADYIEQTGEFIAIPRQLLMLWDGGAGTGDLPEGAAQIATGVSQRVDSVGGELDKLDSIARRCRSFGADGQTSTTQSLLDMVDRVAQSFGAAVGSGA